MTIALRPVLTCLLLVVFSSGSLLQAQTGVKPPKNNQATVKTGGAKQRAKKQKTMGTSTGDVNLSKSQTGMKAPKNNQAVADATKGTNVRQKQKQMGASTGDMVMPQSHMKPPVHDNTVIVNTKPQRQLTKQISKYQGDIVPGESNMSGPKNSGSTVLVREMNRKQMKQIANYQGDLPNNFLAKRASMRQEKNRQVSSYQGDILVRTLRARDQRTRKKAKQIANYRGDLIVRKVKKGMHPSAVYQGGKVKNSYTAKERYRKKMLKKAGNKNGIEDANWQKQKKGRARYDNREAEIWNLQP